MTPLAASPGAPTWWELILAAIPLVAGAFHFLPAYVRDRREQAEREQEDREQLSLLRRRHQAAGEGALATATSMNGGAVAAAAKAEGAPRITASTLLRDHLLARLAPPRLTTSVNTPVHRREVLQMERAASDLSWIGTLLLCEAVLIIFIVLHHFGEITDHYVAFLNHRRWHNTTQTLALLLVRTAAYGTVVSTAIYFLVRFAGTSFDQATRFRKRTHSAHVLNNVLTEYDDNIKSDAVTLHDALEVFRAWNENVESAFTSAKLVKDKQESVAGSVSPFGGAAFNYGKARRRSRHTEDDAD